MKLNKYISFFAVFTLLSASLQNVIYANPVFARTEKEWERLRDNTLEYEEIKGLIEEYNATVKNNEIAYNRFVSDYGRMNSEVRDAYRKAADEILSNIDIPEPSSPIYASALAASVSAESTAKNLLNSADNSTEDAFIQRLTYSMAKDTLIQTAKTNMIKYFSKLHDIEKSELNILKAERGVVSATKNMEVGTGTYADILDKRDALSKAKNALETEKSETENLKKKLIVMTGWNYDANPDISPLPELETEKIKLIDISSDIKRAKENNYTLNINKRKLENASSESTKKNLLTTIASNENGISISMNNLYKNLTAALEAYEYAKGYAVLQDTNLTNARAKASLGTLSEHELRSMEEDKKLADIAYVQAKYSLLLSYENYNMALEGLASVGN